MSSRVRTARPIERAARASLEYARDAAKRCKACPLWKIGTQTVFGEGPPRAKIVLVGEQPGDQEDLQGRPFVGPAGQLLDAALEKAGLDRHDLYVTNAVKHFKHELRGKRRLHKSPAQREILACNKWLQTELSAIDPELIVAMGATAARALFGKAVAVMENRGRILKTADNRSLLVTVHPSYLLRVLPKDRESALQEFVKDLRNAASFAQRPKARATAH